MMANDIQKWIVKSGFIILFLSALIVASGGSESGEYGLSKNQAVTLTIWHSYDGRQLETFDHEVELFNETLGAEKGIIVETFAKGSVNEISKKVLASAQKEVGSEDIPDIFSACGETVYELGEMGILADFGNYMTEEELGEYVDVFLEEGKFSGGENYYLFPIVKSAEILALNKTDWDKFSNATGVSESDLKTWEGIVRVSELYYIWTDSLTEELDDGKAFFGRDTFINYMLIGSEKLEEELLYVEEDQESYHISRKIIRYLWDHYYIPVIKGYYRVEGRFCSSDMRTGDIIACVCSTVSAVYLPSVVTTADGHSYPIETAVYKTPEFEGDETYAVQQGAGMAVIRSSEKMEYAATIFLKWFTEKERNTEFAIKTGCAPVKKEALERSNILNAVENAPKELPQLLKDTFLYASKDIVEHPICKCKPFDTQHELRVFLSKSMEEKARIDREKICQMMELGITYNEAVAVYDTDENFAEWFTDFLEGLKEIRADK